MKTSSCKQKGRLGQQEVVKILLKSFPELTEDDIRSTPMGSQGEDIMLSSRALELVPWDIEVKRGKAFNLVNACKQATSRIKTVKCLNEGCRNGISVDCPSSWKCPDCKGTGKVTYAPVAIGRYDRDKKWYATIELEYLLELIK